MYRHPEQTGRAVVDVLDLFLELAAIESPPGGERPVADAVAAYLARLGVAVEEDDAGARVGAGAGNLLCRLPGARGGDGGVRIFLCAHLDTVPPAGRVEPVVEDGVVRNAGGTILGADNKAAVAVMLEAARRVLEERRPHAGVELLFTPKEEVGLRGAYAFDHTRLGARVGFVYDQAAPIGEVVVGAPTQRSLELRFAGRAAHAGMYPEEGRSAIAAAARAIADMRLGRLDEETSANVGVIAGGTARNIVPDRCVVEAEVRSHADAKVSQLVQEILDAATFGASLAECEVEATVEQTYRAYRFAPGDPPVRLAAAALERCGFAPRYVLTGGGADANVFNERGLPCVNLANGMLDIHTPDERIAVADLEAMVDVTLALVDAAAAARG
ncbi:MAG: M20/M25/M40 family metallo-hydrolase [Thermoleophilia bacterium]|nr:M20/M25/M40 family metallo-hydrolase [Thermoleophilia bacterium]